MDRKLAYLICGIGFLLPSEHLVSQRDEFTGLLKKFIQEDYGNIHQNELIYIGAGLLSMSCLATGFGVYLNSKFNGKKPLEGPVNSCMNKKTNGKKYEGF
jgi:hypothetical protein